MFRDNYRQDSVGELRRLERWFQAICQRNAMVGKLRRFHQRMLGPLTLIIAALGAYLALANAFPHVPTAARDFAVFFPDCGTAQAAGKAPLYRDGPGYRAELDPDGDGVACQPR